jgi:hypothetical protein
MLASISSAPSSARAQRDTGYELALSGPQEVPAGQPARFRGVAYRVRGVAELVPYAGRVRARFGHGQEGRGPWAEVRSATDGTFVVDVPILDVARLERTRIEVEVGPGDDARAFELPLTVTSPYEILLRTDRVLYEPGEPVHVWTLVRDRRTGRPVAGRSLPLEVRGGPIAGISRTLTTGPSGTAELRFELARSAPEGTVDVVLAPDTPFARSTSFRVGTRTWERLMARVELPREPVAPGASVRAVVVVTTPSGAPVRDADVALTVDEASAVTGTTDAQGRAEIVFVAPAYLRNEAGVASVRAEVHHPAHGSVRTVGTLRLAIPLALHVELVPRHGGLVPELDDVVYVRLRDGAQQPPPAGTEVHVEGMAVPGGRATVRTDENGLAELPVRVPRHARGSGAEAATYVLVRVQGPLERLTRLPLPVWREPDVLPTVSRPVLAPGDRLDIALGRRGPPRPVVVEVHDARGEPLLVERVAPGTSRLTLTLPPDRIGLFAVLARTVREDESLESAGLREPFIVRPAGPSFVRVEPTRPRWTVGETARLRLLSPAGVPRSFAAVLVRDLAAHGGEAPFESWFLQRAFDQALLDPSGPAAERLVRAALAAHAGDDPPPRVAAPLLDGLGLPADGGAVAGAPERGVLRDPWPLARELERRGIGPAMVALEAQLEEALQSGALDELTTGTGAARRFRDEPIEDHETLGGEPLTPALLEAAEPSFTYGRVARRVARARLVRLMALLARYLDPGEDASPRARMAAREPWARWLPRMVERGIVDASALDDPWGGRFTLRETASPRFALSPYASRLELVSPGPDGRVGTADDVRDPFERAVPAGTVYAVASGEDALMRRLALLSPTARTLAAITEAYTRVNAEVIEEEIGDAVSARVSEGAIGYGGLGLSGMGAGGSGSGYGSGYGRGIGSRSSSSPRLRVGSASVSGLARVVRERFPPTLLFRGAIDLDPSGVTEIDVPLADAVTTYLVETILWREDGWIWSARTELEVDREVVIEAPVPEMARVGDRLVLPLRVSNRGDTAREVRVQLLPEPALGVAGSEPTTVRLAAGDAAVVPVEVPLDRVGEAPLVVVASAPDGRALDAVRRPVRVLTSARRVHVERDTLAAGDGVVELSVPDGAEARRGRVRLAVGLAVIPAPHRAWGELNVGDGDPVRLAFGLGARPAASEDRRRAVVALTSQLDGLGRGDDQRAQATRTRSLALIGLSPRAADDSPDLRALMERLAREVSSDAVAVTEDPATWVVAAAALGWSAPDGTHVSRVAELVRRLERFTIEVGEDRWLPTSESPLRATVLLAMAELSLGRRERAFTLLRTVARWSARGHGLPEDVRVLARDAARRLMGDSAPTSATVEIDGVPREVALVDGAAELEDARLGAPGRHLVRVRTADGAPLWVRVDADYGVPWSVRPPRPGPLALELEGEVGAHDRISGLELVIRNRLPRTLPRPLVAIELPTGAELTAAERRRIESRTYRLELGEGVLTLALPPLRPGNEVRIPLPFRWTVQGRLPGLGMAAYAEDRPDEVTVVSPRELSITTEEVRR